MGGALPSGRFTSRVGYTRFIFMIRKDFSPHFHIFTECIFRDQN